MTIDNRVRRLEEEVVELREQLHLVTELAYYGYSGIKYSRYHELMVERKIKKFKKAGRVVPVDAEEINLRSEVYNALSEVVYRSGASQEEMGQAIDWFNNKFYEGGQYDE
jgi:hypothetical protein